MNSYAPGWPSGIRPHCEAVKRELFTQWRYQQRLFYIADDDGMPLPPWYQT